MSQCTKSKPKFDGTDYFCAAHESGEKQVCCSIVGPPPEPEPPIVPGNPFEPEPPIEPPKEPETVGSPPDVPPSSSTTTTTPTTTTSTTTTTTFKAPEPECSDNPGYECADRNACEELHSTSNSVKFALKSPFGAPIIPGSWYVFIKEIYYT